MPYDANATKILTYKEEPYPTKKVKKKKETVAQKTRKKLSEKTLPPKKERGLFGGTLGVGVSKINKRRRLLEESLKY